MMMQFFSLESKHKMKSLVLNEKGDYSRVKYSTYLFKVETNILLVMVKLETCKISYLIHC